MKILLHLDRPFSHLLGGAETWMIMLSRAFAARGHLCEMYFMGDKPPSNAMPKDVVTNSGSLAHCLDMVHRREFDIVHACTEDWKCGIEAVRWLPHRPKLLLIHHGVAHPAWNSRNCEGIAGCSTWAASDQQKTTDVPVQVVQNAIDTVLFHPPESVTPGYPIVAWVARGAHLSQKRIDKLAALAPLLRKAGIRLWIASPDGPEDCAPYATETLLSIAEFWQAVPRQQMPVFFQEIVGSGGCCLSTSSWEGLPMVLLEAQATGCPVIAPAVRGITECVHPDHGGVLYPFDLEPERLAGLIRDTLSDWEGMEARRRATREHICDRFSVERMAQEYLKMYEDAPYPARTDAAAQKALRFASPLKDRDNYRQYRVQAGLKQYRAALELILMNSRVPAACALRAACAMCPTLFLRPRPLARLLKYRGVGRQTRPVARPAIGLPGEQAHGAP